MHARLAELDGKYYGTVVLFGDEPGSIDGNIKVWHQYDFIPSFRQLESWGLTMESYQDADMTSDGHFESRASYMIAKAIVDAINKVKLPSYGLI
jgi:hypothetical protein